MKKDYEAPAVVVLGTVRDLTLANMSGPTTDLQLNTPSVGA